MATLFQEEKVSRPIGENVTRVDAHEKVIGAALFADDLQFGPGLLFARIKRSPHPHALIKRIDVSKARELPGVKAVVTGQDFPGYIGLYLQDRHIFCRDRVRYVGDPVAGVAAITEEISERALDLIEVDYEILPGVFDPIFGAGPDAPVLEVMRREALAYGVPFWNFFNTMPFGPHTDPTEAQLRWQIYASSQALMSHSGLSPWKRRQWARRP